EQHPGQGIAHASAPTGQRWSHMQVKGHDGKHPEQRDREGREGGCPRLNGIDKGPGDGIKDAGIHAPSYLGQSAMIAMLMFSRLSMTSASSRRSAAWALAKAAVCTWSLARVALRALSYWASD